MSEFGDRLIKSLESFLQDLKDGKPLKTTTVAKVNLAKLLQELGLTVSMSEGKRIVTLGAVRINGELHTDIMKDVIVREGDIIEVGKNKRVELKLGGFTPRTQVSKIEPARFEDES